MKPRFRRTLPEANDACDLPHGQVNEVVEGQYGSLLGIESFERVPDRHRPIETADGVVPQNGVVAGGIRSQGRGRPATPRPQGISAPVHEDGTEPVWEAVRLAESRQLSPCAQQGVLRDIAGVIRPHDRGRQPIQLGEMALRQSLKGRFVASPGSLDVRVRVRVLLSLV